MKSAILSAALFIATSYEYVDLGPAYNVHMTGSTDWKLVGQYEKDPVFVEGFEFIDNKTLIESVGQYWGSKIRIVTLEDTEAVDGDE